MKFQENCRVRERRFGTSRVWSLFLNGKHLSGVCLGVDLRIDTKKALFVKKRLDYVLKICYPF